MGSYLEAFDHTMKHAGNDTIRQAEKWVLWKAHLYKGENKSTWKAYKSKRSPTWARHILTRHEVAGIDVDLFGSSTRSHEQPCPPFGVYSTGPTKVYCI